MNSYGVDYRAPRGSTFWIRPGLGVFRQLILRRGSERPEDRGAVATWLGIGCRGGLAACQTLGPQESYEPLEPREGEPRQSNKVY